MEAKEVWMMIGVAVVVAIVVFFAASKITGNVVSVPTPSSEYNACLKNCHDSCVRLPPANRTGCKANCAKVCPKYQDVYTKDEVDARLEMASVDALTKCTQIEPSKEHNRWCGATCNDIGKKAIGYSNVVYYVSVKEDGQRDLNIIPVFDWGDGQPMSSCGEGEVIGCGLAGNAREMMELEKEFNATTFTIDSVKVVGRCICC